MTSTHFDHRKLLPVFHMTSQVIKFSNANKVEIFIFDIKFGKFLSKIVQI